jgi:glycosyltransferase involved in cell wall biosynthesis
VVEQFRKFKDPYPFFRGIVAEVGFDRVEIPFDQPLRKRGITKNNFLTLYDIGMLGIISYSKLPLRLASFMGFAVAGISLLAGLVYFLYKLFFWNSFQVGMAPLVIGMFFIGSVQLLFLGIVGEYVAGIYTQVKDRPLVIERERIGFD